MELCSSVAALEELFEKKIKNKKKKRV